MEQEKNGFTSISVSEGTRNMLKMLSSIKQKNYDELIQEKFLDDFSKMKDVVATLEK